MKALLTDPVVLICSGVIIFGIIGLLWAIGKFRRMTSPEAEIGEPDNNLLPVEASIPEIDYGAPVLSTPAARSSPAPISRDVSDRLESMTQRLAEMQSVLMKQSANASAAQGAAGGVGQGFSPETIEKLLKIIGNVIQQVDILQKNINVPKETTAPKAEAVGTPFTKI